VSIRTHGCKGSLLKVRKGKYKGELGGHRWSLPAERCFCSSGALKTYANPWEGEKKIYTLQLMSGEDMGSAQPGEGGS
jgi:hypothetical protein